MVIKNISKNHPEHFMVWMRTAGLPEFRKLWGRIETQLPAGNYLININNSMLILSTIFISL
jgi:hypothetical protein